MKKTLLLVLICIVTTSLNQLYAQNGKSFSFGFGLEGGAMVGDKNVKQAFSSQAGLSLRFAVKAGPGYVTFTPGASLVIPKKVDEENLKLGTNIPLKLGYKYNFASKFFVMAEAGYSIYSFYSADLDGEVDYESIRNSKTSTGGFTWAPSIGVDLGKLELALRYESTAFKKEDSKASLAALRIGFNF